MAELLVRVDLLGNPIKQILIDPELLVGVDLLDDPIKQILIDPFQQLCESDRVSSDWPSPQ